MSVGRVELVARHILIASEAILTLNELTITRDNRGMLVRVHLSQLFIPIEGMPKVPLPLTAQHLYITDQFL